MTTDIYKKYYIDSDRIVDILKTGLIVFDTSALLDIYFYSENSQENILSTVFPVLSKRLWIPAQVYYEFLKDKDVVARKPESQYPRLLSIEDKNEDGGYLAKIKKLSEEIGKEELQEIEGQLRTLEERASDSGKHPFVGDVNYQIVKDAIKKIKEEIVSFQDTIKSFDEFFSAKVSERISEVRVLPDAVKIAVERYFEIGNEYTFERMLEISVEGEHRYLEKIPPGYMDAKEKTGLQKYGDLFAWKQILEKACADKKTSCL